MTLLVFGIGFRVEGEASRDDYMRRVWWSFSFSRFGFCGVFFYAEVGGSVFRILVFARVGS